MTLRPLLTLALIAATGVGASAQEAPLRLREALRRADDAAFANRMAAGDRAARNGQALAPLRGILPSVRVETGYIRTTDPIGAFATSLRQRIITAADFDPTRLNDPAAIGNYQAALVVEQPLVNADAWAGRAAARRAADAGDATADWTRLTTRADVTRAYYGAVLAAERAATLQTAADAAHAHVRQAESMVRNGLATRSDALLASVRAGEVDAQLLEARSQAATARLGLAVAMGSAPEPGRAPALPASLPDAAAIVAFAAPDTAANLAEVRQDVRAAEMGADAARADALRARAAYLPRLNAFARYDWNSPSQPYAGQRSWTAGVMATWTPFAGASELADVQTSAGRAAQARAGAEAAAAGAALDAERTRATLAVALARMAIAGRAVAQSAEAQRIVARKYEGELATIVELLDAQAVATQSALAFAAARYEAIAADAERRQALGRDPGTLAALDDAVVAAAATTTSPTIAAGAP